MRATHVEFWRTLESGRREITTIDAGPDAVIVYSPRWQRLHIHGPKINVTYEYVLSVTIDSEEKIE